MLSSSKVGLLYALLCYGSSTTQSQTFPCPVKTFVPLPMLEVTFNILPYKIKSSIKCAVAFSTSSLRSNSSGTTAVAASTPPTLHRLLDEHMIAAARARSPPPSKSSFRVSFQITLLLLCKTRFVPKACSWQGVILQNSLTK